MKEVSLALGKPGEKVLEAALKAFQRLFKRKSYKPEDLSKVKEYKQLIDATNKVIQPAVADNVVEGPLRKALEQDVFLFSGLKTHAQLFEASRMLIDDRGQRKSFAQFEQDFQRLQATYNNAWLEAEFNYANAAATAADRWQRLDSDSDFVLQYRTANDERVRQSHEVLHNTTLPKEDPFWDSYYPPNGWNCRCIAVEIRSGSHKPSDPLEAAEKGEKATTQLGRGGVNKAAIFRFNPGKQKVIFPPKHPYRRVQGAEGAKPIILSIINPSDDDVNRALRIAKDNEIRNWAKKNIPNTGLLIKQSELITGKLLISRSSIKRMGDHFTEPRLKEVAKHVTSNLNKIRHIDSAPLDPNSKNFERKRASGVTQYHYYNFEWRGEQFRLNTEEIKGKFEKPYAVNLIKK